MERKTEEQRNYCNLKQTGFKGASLSPCVGLLRKSPHNVNASLSLSVIRTFSRHLFKKKSILFSRYSSFYTNKNTHTWNEFMGASLSVKNQKKKNTWKDDGATLEEKENFLFHQ